MAVQTIGNPLGIHLGISHDHYLALGKVYFEARHFLEAEEEEFEVLNIFVGPFHHHNGVIRILEVGQTPRGHQMRADPPNVTRALGQVQYRGERINHKVEEKWGYRVSLSDPLARQEVWSDLPIYVYRRPSARYELHHAGNPVVVKSTFKHHLPKEGPMDGVIGFMEVDLEEHRAHSVRSVYSVCMVRFIQFSGLYGINTLVYTI